MSSWDNSSTASLPSVVRFSTSERKHCFICILQIGETGLIDYFERHMKYFTYLSDRMHKKVTNLSTWRT